VPTHKLCRYPGNIPTLYTKVIGAEGLTSANTDSHRDGRKQMNILVRSYDLKSILVHCFNRTFCIDLFCALVFHSGLPSVIGSIILTRDLQTHYTSLQCEPSIHHQNEIKGAVLLLQTYNELTRNARPVDILISGFPRFKAVVSEYLRSENILNPAIF
jgi:hypothetical protein